MTHPDALTDEQLEALARVLVEMVSAATLDRLEAGDDEEEVAA